MLTELLKEPSADWKYLAEIRINDDIPSLNKLLGMRTRWGKPIPISSLTKQWSRKIAGAQIEQLGPQWLDKILVTTPHPVRKLVLVRSCRRKMDTDNCYGGAKVIIDSLKSKIIYVNENVRTRTGGWFYDDNPKYLDLVVKQRKEGEPGMKPFVTFYLWEKVNEPTS